MGWWCHWGQRFETSKRHTIKPPNVTILLLISDPSVWGRPNESVNQVWHLVVLLCVFSMMFQISALETPFTSIQCHHHPMMTPATMPRLSSDAKTPWLVEYLTLSIVNFMFCVSEVWDRLRPKGFRRGVRQLDVQVQRPLNITPISIRELLPIQPLMLSAKQGLHESCKAGTLPLGHSFGLWHE